MESEASTVTKEESDNVTATFFSLVEADQQGDEKSVYWDGKKASVIDDEFDSAQIDDGRTLGEGYETAGVPDMFSFQYPNDMKLAEIKSESAEEYCLEAENLEILVRQIDFEKETEAMKNNTNYQMIATEFFPEYVTKYFEQYQLYIGFTDTQNARYAGYTLLFQSNLADRSYQITVAGIGNMEEIRLRALYIMDHFEVLFY